MDYSEGQLKKLGAKFNVVKVVIKRHLFLQQYSEKCISNRNRYVYKLGKNYKPNGLDSKFLISFWEAMKCKEIKEKTAPYYKAMKTIPCKQACDCL